MTELSRDELQRYSRHILLPQVGLAGQKKINEASVLLVGAGGLGSPIALYLAAAGVGHIGLVDHDQVDETNLQRQVLHDTAQIGSQKTDSARQRLLALNPHIQVDIYPETFRAENARGIARDYDILVDGSDNFPTRYLLNDLAVLTGKPYVYGSIFQFEGQVSVFDARRGPCYRCLFPSPPSPEHTISCAEGGVLGVLPGVIGAIQATEVLKLMCGIGEPLIGRLLIYDALDMSFQEIQLKKNPACQLCSSQPVITDLLDYQEFCGVPENVMVNGLPAEWEIEPLDLHHLRQQGIPMRLIDLRRETERAISHIDGAEHIPMDQILAALAGENRDCDLILFCRSGVRSARAVRWLRQAGFTRVRHLAGGINAWADEVDPTIAKY
jgi:adenylyltransferase/sulfurtransferase